MNKLTLCLLFLVGTCSLFAQTTADMEDLSVPVDSFLNGSEGTTGYASGNVFLPNSYNSMFNSYTGWAVSTKTDTVTAGFTNQYSCAAGSGAEGSATFALANMFSPGVLHITNNGAGKQVEGAYFTTNTYAYRSMLEGDQFAKRFGGDDGNDPDFFLLTIKGYLADVLGTDSVDFYLADYRFADNADDYIIKDWTWVDLTSLGDVDSLQFTLRSSDTGVNGMNTPAYFCMDQLKTRNFPTAVAPQAQLDARFYPNPVQDIMQIEWQQSREGQLQIVDMAGTIVRRSRLQKGNQQISLEDLAAGLYLLRIQDGEIVQSQMFIKQ